MPLQLHRLARAVRHAPGLRGAKKLWSLVRPAYHYVLDPFGRGVPITLGGRPVRVPAALLGTYPDWTGYEGESFEALAAWLDAQPGRPTLLDIGCSFGLVTSFAVQVRADLDVIAFDSDLVSLRALDAVVPAGARRRVRRVEGLLGPVHTSGQTLASAVVSTLHRLPQISAPAAINRSHYRCFGEAGSEQIPQHRLDVLLTGVEFPGPVLLKCDVEGAELAVLENATGFLTRARPTLLLSVHPPALPQYGHRVADVESFLARHGYGWRVIACDHEEHWLAEPNA